AGERATAITEVAAEIVKPTQPALIPKRLDGLGAAPAGNRRDPRGRPGRESAPLLLFGGNLEMHAQLFLDIRVAASADHGSP
ncbi:hypothetical protein WFJ45_22875, partial [Salmonella enterica subsp. enterica serovar Minnesota]|uniref:hypothetical protein n=1 Tax=Salmonella enterica TaxID=28901 RepID=UPI003D288676